MVLLSPFCPTALLNGCRNVSNARLVAIERAIRKLVDMRKERSVRHSLSAVHDSAPLPWLSCRDLLPCIFPKLTAK